MKTPVLIPAKNEEARLGRCLERLDSSLVEPIVLANDCSDGTIDVAKRYGVGVLETDTPGKLPAIQNALRILNTPHQPILIIDADSYPVSPRNWHKKMTTHMGGENPEVRTGPILYTPDAHNLLYALYRSVRSEQYARSTGSHLVSEANMSLYLDRETMDKIIGMDHYYPGEGYMIRKIVWEQGGTYSRADLSATVATSTRWLGRHSERHNWLAEYQNRAPEGSIVPEDLLTH